MKQTTNINSNTPFSIPSILITSVLLLLSPQTAVGSVATTNFRWASTGGGWRSMVADMGFANLFYQAGLIGNGGSGSEHQFSAISTNSGATWFGTQLFYSQEFYAQTVEGSPDDLHDFVVDWMNAYLNLTIINATSDGTVSSDCSDIIPDDPRFNDLKPLCQVFIAYQGDWAAFIADMLTAVSTNSYNDADFATRAVDSNNRIEALREIDFIAQSTLTPQSRIRSSETLVNFGPSNSNSEQLYATVLPAMYEAGTTSTGFTIGGADPIQTYASGPASKNFDFNDFSNYYLYPGMNGSITTTTTETEEEGAGRRNLRGNRGSTPSGGSSPTKSYSSKPTGTMRKPFGGKTPTTSQISAISSAAAGVYSPLVPSTFAQVASLFRNQISETLDIGLLGKNHTSYVHKKFDNAINKVYQTPLFDDIAVCGQWPEPCDTEQDARFVDGGFTDNPSLAMNVAQYQRNNNKDDEAADEALKIVLTNTNHAAFDSEYEQSMLLSYFNTTFNQNVEPGEFIWAPGQKTPWPSSQIFGNKLDGTDLDALIQPIEGTNLTTAVISDLRTIDNPIYGVKANQKVDILLININNDIGNMVIGSQAIEYYTPKLAELASQDIASNTVLLERVQNFFF